MMNNNMNRPMRNNMNGNMNHNMNGNIDKNSLLQKINVVSFAINDCTLYLDTHPCDEEALACVNELIPIRRNLLDKYSQCYGPLTIDSVSPSNKWEWAMGPMPWEGGCK